VERSGARTVLRKGIDESKDQSYVLYVLTPEVLDMLLLPLGERTKDEMRNMARAMGLPAAYRVESQEICFVEDRDYPRFISTVTGTEEEPGPILDEKGNTIGTHGGIHRYTVGQRKGLGIASPTPLYVTKIDAEKNAVHVGPREAAMSREFTVADINWLVPKGGEFRADVKVRSMMEARPALVKPVSENRAHVEYDEPQWAPAPGQAAVFYEGDIVTGGGVIEMW
jgi:tRNA-specific 2-thiouridylase